MREDKSIYKDDIGEDGLVKDEVLTTFYFPVIDASYILEHKTICITGQGFGQRVQIRLTREQLLNFAELVKLESDNKTLNLTSSEAE